jgi:ribonucleoside-diphosphate reductase beta chain
MDQMLNGAEHANFFENRATEYARASTQGSWEDVFEDKAFSGSYGDLDAERSPETKAAAA